MRVNIGRFNPATDDTGGNPRSQLLMSPVRMWKLGVLAVVATVISVGLVVGGSSEGVVSAVGADVVTSGSGDWSNPTTWSTGSVPQPGQSVEVTAGHRVIFDSDLTDAGIGKLDIFGTLEFSRDVSTVLESKGNIIVRDGGELIIGTESDPVHPSINHTIVFDVANDSLFVGGALFEETDTGLWVFNGGRWESNGAPIESPWTKLAAPAMAGTTSVIAEGDLSDWYVGGDVLITATGRNISNSIGNTTFFSEDEERKIASLNPLGNGTTEVVLTAPLSYDHDGSTDPDALRGEIALLTRNVKVTSKTNERAHTMYMWGSLGAPTFTQFKKLGPRDAFSRYPLHFHLMAESSVDRQVRGNVIWDSENRFVVIHNSLGMTLESNIGYRGLRSGFWLEESFAGAMGPKPKGNTLIRNLAVKVSSVDTSDRRVTAIHAQRENHYIDNVVVSMTGSTDASGFGWQENEIASAGTAFVGNETHSSAAIGLFGWQNHGQYHIVDYAGWRNNYGVKWGAYSNNVQFHGAQLVGNTYANFRSRNNKPFIQDSYLAGEADYPTKDGLFIDFYTLPPSPDNPALTIRNVFENHTGYDINHIAKTTCGPSGGSCTPTFNAIVDSELRSANNIRFGNDWETTDTFFDVKGYDGTVPGLPANFRLTRPDQPKPSANAFIVPEFNAWLNPDIQQPSKWTSPPTVQWDQDYSGVDLSAGPVTFSATARGFSGDEGEIEFFVDEFEDGRPWVAEYFPNPNLSGAPVAVLNQMEIDFNWGLENPGFVRNKDASALLGLLPDGSWSVRLTRDIRSEGGTYKFQYRTNDGFRLYVDNKLIRSKWNLASTCCNNIGTETINLPAGDHEVKIEFFHNSQDSAKLQFNVYRVLSGDTDTESFTFDAANWDRKYVTVYARAHDPATGFYAYSPVQRFRNPSFAEAVPSAPGTPPTSAPTPTSPAPTATTVIAPTAIATTVITATLVVPTPTVVPDAARTIDGLLALYEFNEGAGSTVTDTSGVGAALDLTVKDPANVSWIAGGLRIDSGTLVDSAVAASKISTAASTSGEITIEAWIDPANVNQGGPARIVSISADPWNRNLTLGQNAKDYDVRLRTTGTSRNGTPSTATTSDSAVTALTHVVYTRSASGIATVYVDGVAVTSKTVSGNLGDWNADYRIAIGNEFSGDRPWLGDLYLVALFDRALSASEIEASFRSGSEIPFKTQSAPPEPEPTATPLATATSVPTTTPVPTATPITLHVADLDGSAQKFKNFWTAHLLVAVTDSEGNPVKDALVSGSWTGTSGITSCITNSLGVCLVWTDGTTKSIGAVTWQVSSVSHPVFGYEPALNSDPDGDSNGTTIVISKP